MSAIYSKQILSASTNGKQIGVTGTQAPGNIVHTSSAGSLSMDEVWLYAVNNGTAAANLSMWWGGTGSSDLSQYVLLPNLGRQLIVDGKLATQGIQVSAWLAANGTVALDGFVNNMSGLASTFAIDPRIVDWTNRVVRNGGATPSLATQQALSTFVQTLTAKGLMTKMVLMTALVPDSLIAAATPIIPGPGNDPWTNNNFISGDLSVNGLTGNGSNKYLDTGLIPSAASILSSTNAGLTAYVYDNSASVSGYAIACAGAANSSHFALFTSDSVGTKSDGFIWRFVNTGTDWVQGNKPASGGYFSVNRTSGTQIDMYFGNSSTAHFNLAPGGGGAQTGAIITDQRLFAFALNSNGSPASYTTNAISFLAVHQGLTAGDSSNFFSAIQALRIALGGGFR